MKKKALILEYMDLTEAEKSSFWPVYEYYSAATKNLELECIYLISLYSRDFNKLSADDLNTYLMQVLKNDVTLARLRRVFFKRFKKALSAEQAAAFMQLDDAFRAIIRLNVQKGAPPLEMVRGVLFTEAAGDLELTDNQSGN